MSNKRQKRNLNRDRIDRISEAQADLKCENNQISKYEPHGPWLKNGNPVCDLSTLPKCNATAKTTGKSCGQPAMANGKCHFHGGKSTGPRTVEGWSRSCRAAWKHGYYSAESRDERAERRFILKLLRESEILPDERC